MDARVREKIMVGDMVLFVSFFLLCMYSSSTLRSNSNNLFVSLCQPLFLFKFHKLFSCNPHSVLQGYCFKFHAPFHRLLFRILPLQFDNTCNIICATSEESELCKGSVKEYNLKGLHWLVNCYEYITCKTNYRLD